MFREGTQSVANARAEILFVVGFRPSFLTSAGRMSPVNNATSTLKILLIQVRADNLASRHERDCVIEMTGLQPEQVDFINVVVSPGIAAERIERADGVIIGGSGSHSVVNDDPFTSFLMDDVKRMRDRSQPLFGTCWGHQFIARALGGEVVTDLERSEVGVVDVTSTLASANDPLFCKMPKEYTALMGHHDHVRLLPEGATELAFSEVCQNQAFVMDGLPIYGTQYHAELLPKRLIERLRMFRQYMPDPNEFETLKASMRPTPDTANLLKRFLTEVVCA